MVNIAPSILIGNKSKSLEYFLSLRSNSGLFCPSCFSNSKLYVLGDGRFKCSKCFYRFNKLSGTYLGKLYIPPEEISHLLYLFTMDIPAFKAKQYLRVSLKTAHRAYRIFRKAIYDKSLATNNSLERPGNNPPKWLSRRGKFVIGISQNAHRVSIFPTNENESASIISLPRRTEAAGELIYSSDRHQAFGWFKVDTNYVTIEKKQTSSKKKKPSDDVVIEQFWNFLKIHLYRYRGIPKIYFSHYLKEAEFRFNHKDGDQFFELSKLMTSTFSKNRTRGLPLP